MMDRFLTFSAEVTAFTRFELLGTGQAQAYLEVVTTVIGAPLLSELLDAYTGIEGSDREQRLRQRIFGDEKLGPLARNIVKLWYTGVWYELPQAWTNAFGAFENDSTFVVNRASYAEGLLWMAIGAHAPGAKAPGYASWVEAPKIPAI